jgi:hypothetical protein
MTKVNPVQTTTYDLTNGNNPITFGTGTDINVSSGTETGVFGSNAQSWAVTNQGAISGALYGVNLADGGSVTNNAGATISGGHSGLHLYQGYLYQVGYGGGVRILGGAGTVTNSGKISGGAFGVDLAEGGSVTNEAGATISGLLVNKYGYNYSVGVGILVARGAGTVTNAGQIIDFSSGVELQAGGSVTNQAGATISPGGYGARVGIDISGGAGTVTNAGKINGFITGVELDAGGSVTNEAGATISGGRAVVLGEGGSVTNEAGGAIYGFASGVRAFGDPTTLINAGAISASRYGGTAVALYGGGSVTNEAGATIAANSGGRAGIRAFGVAMVSNAGTISGSVANNIGYAGVGLYTGGSVINEAGATITGPYAVYINGGAGTVTNAGDIRGQNNSLGTSNGSFGGFWGGVFLGEGGSVTNQAGATISGFDFGISAMGNAATVMNAGDISGEGGVIAIGSAATVTNSGAITGTKVGSFTFPSGFTFPLGDGVFMNAGGAVTNMGSGTIAGARDGVYIAGGGAVTNAGTISGTIASIKFAGAGANTLTLETDSTLNGDAIGSTASGATNALVLEGHGTANNNFDNFNTLDVQANGNWTLGGDSTFGATTVSGRLVVAGDASSGATTLGDPAGDLGQLVIASTGAWDLLGDSGIGLGGPAPSSIMNSGLFEKTGGTGTSAIAPQLVNKGSVLVSSGALDFEGAVSGNGADTVSGASTLEFDSTVGGGQTAGFTGGGGALDLLDPLGFAAKISGFAATDKVELSGDWIFSSFSETGNKNMGTLTLSSGSNHLSLHFLGDYAAGDFTIASGTGTTTTIGHI